MTRLKRSLLQLATSAALLVFKGLKLRKDEIVPATQIEVPL